MNRVIQLMNRAEIKAMADQRAMEEQMERTNPLSGRGKGKTNASEQGKMLMEHLGALHGGAYAEQFHEGMKGAGFFSNLGHGLSDVAGMFGLGRECESKETMSGGLRSGEYEGEGRFSDLGHSVSNIAGMFGLGKLSAAEKKALQSVLAKHQMNGGATFSHSTQDFSGHHKGAGFFSNLGHGLSDVAGMFGLGKISAAEKKTLESILKKHQKGPMADMLPSSEMEDLQSVIKKHGGKHGPVPYGRPQKPMMMVEANGGMSACGKQKRIVGAGDGRRKRAEVVKKVMMEKGLKLIDASKYVKEHGLYKP